LETKNAYEKGRENVKDLKHTIAGYPKTKSLNSDTTLKHFLDYHRAYHPLEKLQKGIYQKNV
jgi:hypothetical protein